MPADILAGLNPEQRDAVLHFDSPLLIVAGAGSGKTRVITHKIAHLVLEKGLAPHQVLAVTFTNKAASEMKVRIEAITGIQASLFPISTFHALGLRILRESGSALGFDAQWQVMDDDEQRRLVERLLKEKFPHLAKDGDSLMRKIGLAKMGLHYPNNSEFLRQKGFAEDEISAFAHYHAAQQQNKLWDYEDLISFAVILLRDHDAVREKYQRRFRYLLVDEFQDTNPNQYELIKLLSHDRRSITVVGDDDQAIYSWRGASVRFLFDFERDFPGTRIIKLEQNYRSTPEILNFANLLISQNTVRQTQADVVGHGKQPPGLRAAQPLQGGGGRGDRPPGQLPARRAIPACSRVAILYRINSQSLALETEFIKQRIAFRILKGLRFFDRKEIRDVLAMLRLALNPADDLAFQRLVEFLPLGIGSRTLETLRAFSRERSLPLFAALEQCLDDKFTSRPLFSPAARPEPAEGRHAGRRDPVPAAAGIGIPGDPQGKGGRGAAAQHRRAAGIHRQVGGGEPRRPVQRPAGPHDPGAPRGQRRREDPGVSADHAQRQGAGVPHRDRQRHQLGLHAFFPAQGARRDRGGAAPVLRGQHPGQPAAGHLHRLRPAIVLPAAGRRGLLPARLFVTRDHRRHFPAPLPRARRRHRQRATAASSSIPSSAAAASWKRSRRAST